MRRYTRKRACGGTSPQQSQAKQSQAKQSQAKQAQDTSIFIYKSLQVSTQSNTDRTFEEVGIIHITESAAINTLRALATNTLNIFGNKGFDNTIYDTARNAALSKLMAQVAPNQKISNLRMEIANETGTQLFFVHLYGTLLEKKVAGAK